MKRKWTAEQIVESLRKTQIGDEDIGKRPDSIIIRSYIEYAKHNSNERVTVEQQIAGSDTKSFF